MYLWETRQGTFTTPFLLTNYEDNPQKTYSRNADVDGTFVVWTVGKKIEQMEDKAKTLTGLATATFGTGCFWCTEAVYQEMEGVESVVSGYSVDLSKIPLTNKYVAK